MRALTLLTALSAPLLASAHATVQAVWINDVDQGLGNSASGYIRSPPNNSPLTDVKSTSMTCNVNNSPTAKTLSVKSGDKVTFEWHHETRSSSDQIIDPSHNGPVLVYIAPTSTGSSGSGWVKLSEDGFSGGQWAVQRLRANGGKHSITIPDLAAGQYLLRPEIIALHEGYRSGGAQFYMECVQIEITSSGSKTLPAGVSIPGTYSATDPGILFDLYNAFTSYIIPGPAVWDGSSSGSGAGDVNQNVKSSTTPAATTAAATSSAKPTTAPPTTTTSSSAMPVAASSVKPTTAPPATSSGSSSSSKPVTSSIVKPTTLQTVTTRKTRAPQPTTTTTPTPAPTPTGASGDSCGGSTGAEAGPWEQCGGMTWTGATRCKAGLTCKVQNAYYSQCLST